MSGSGSGNQITVPVEHQGANPRDDGLGGTWSSDGYTRTRSVATNLSNVGEFLKSSASKGINAKDLNSVSITELYSHDDQHKLLGTNYGSNAAIDAYNAWNAQQNASNADHQTYVNMVNGNQGRQGTILVAPNGQGPSSITASPDPSTILGVPKSRLGGLQKATVLG